MENQQQPREENLERDDAAGDYSSGPLANVSNDADTEDMDDEDALEEESAADDELDEDL